MPTQRKSAKGQSAYKATGLPTTIVETDRRIPLIVLAVIALIMAVVLLFTQCSGPAASPASSSVPAIGEPAVEGGSSASSDAVEQVDPPSNPAAKASLEEYTWEELSQISAKIADAATDDDAIYVAKQYGFVNASGRIDGSAAKSVALGDGTNVSVRIIGFNHDSASDGSGKAGITFMFTDGIMPMAYNEDGSNLGGWPSSSVSSALYTNVFSQLPADLTERIVEVSKPSNTGAVDSVTESNDVIWLPSYVELVGSVDSSMGDIAATLQKEGSQYQLFKDSGVAATGGNSVLVMHDGGQAGSWWLRSADAGTADSWCYVDATGHPDKGGAANQQYLVVPCFCL